MTGAEDTNSDFPSIGNEDLLKHGFFPLKRAWILCLALYPMSPFSLFLFFFVHLPKSDDREDFGEEDNGEDETCAEAGHHRPFHP